MELFSVGGLGTLPRIFDTAIPGDEIDGDLDLGSPNERCDGGGPGVGEGGEPGEMGENCIAQGNVLIIQEDNENAAEIPDDNAKGGIIMLKFPGEGGKYMSEIGLMDIDYTATITVVTDEDETTIPVPIRGDNSVQTVGINQANVKWIEVMFERSGAITFISFK